MIPNHLAAARCSAGKATPGAAAEPVLPFVVWANPNIVSGAIVPGGHHPRCDLLQHEVKGH